MSKMDSINSDKPKTLATTLRWDVRTAATLILCWEELGEPINSISQLSRLSIETFAEMLTAKKFPHLVVASSVEAGQILKAKGLLDPEARGRKQRRSYVKQLELEDALLHGPDPSAPVKRANVGKKVSDNFVKRATEVLNETMQEEPVVDVASATKQGMEAAVGNEDISEATVRRNIEDHEAKVAMQEQIKKAIRKED